MHRTAMVLAILTTMVAASARAQPDLPPQVVPPENTISLSVGQAQKVRFPVAFDKVIFGTKEMVDATPLSDREMIFQGLAAGETIMIAQKDGKEVYSATVFVGTEPGHEVKMYGHSRDKDYVSFFCTDSSCGRADPDLTARDNPSSVSVTERVPTASGGFTEKTKSYGR